jgi:hypothetical protein
MRGQRAFSSCLENDIRVAWNLDDVPQSSHLSGDQENFAFFQPVSMPSSITMKDSILTRIPLYLFSIVAVFSMTITIILRQFQAG